QTLPRVVQWAIWAGAFLLVFLVVIKPALIISDRIETDASRLASAMARRSDLTSPGASDAGLITYSVAVSGTPLMPARGATALKAVTLCGVATIIILDIGVTAVTIERLLVRLSGDTASALGVPIIRIIIEVTSEASPEVVSAVLADLERAPEVAAISLVKIDR